MTRAEERAFAYQRELGMIDSVSDEHIVARRMGFYDGYRAAEKDLALTWKDIRTIINIDIEMIDDPEAHPEWMEEQPFYEEILWRFNKAKEVEK